MEIDHIIPEALGGLTEEGNLWLACSLCNEHKGHKIAVLDPETSEIVWLFDPRRQVWREHVTWTAAGDRIVGVIRNLLESCALQGGLEGLPPLQEKLHALFSNRLRITPVKRATVVALNLNRPSLVRARQACFR